MEQIVNEETVNLEQMTLILKNMEEAACMTAKNGLLLYANSALLKLFGFDEDAIGTKKIWESIPYVEQNDNLIQLFIDGVSGEEKTAQNLVDYVNNDGESYKLWVNLIYMQEDGGNFVIVINDVTKQVKVNDAFVRYTSPEIADFILNSPKGEEQGGESRDVSILMSDLRAFTSMSSELEASKLITMLNHYFEKMVEIIERNSGTVIEFLGDGIFVIFGAPQEEPNHADNAVRCALEMQNAMAEVNQWNRENGFIDLEMGIGINSGEAVVGNIGSAQKMKYGAIGETVNLAGRIEGYTIGGQIYISEQTKSRLKEEPHVAVEHSILPKGAATPTTVYEIDGLGSNCKLKKRTSKSNWHVLAKPDPLDFFVLNGKIVDETPHHGWLTAVSGDLRFARLTSEFEMPVSTDIMMDVGIQLYGKVTGVDDNGYLVGFTVRSEGFSQWGKRILRRKTMS